MDNTNAKAIDGTYRAIFNALTIWGPNPDHHQEQIMRLKEEWPDLWEALDNFVREVDKEIIAGRLM